MSASVQNALLGGLAQVPNLLTSSPLPLPLPLPLLPLPVNPLAAGIPAIQNTSVSFLYDDAIKRTQRQVDVKVNTAAKLAARFFGERDTVIRSGSSRYPTSRRSSRQQQLSSPFYLLSYSHAVEVSGPLCYSKLPTGENPFAGG